MDQILSGSFAPVRFQLWPRDSFRVVDWNIDRGTQLQGILEFIKEAKADVILLQEVDMNAKRTRRLDIAREIARALQLNFVFGTEFQELTQGSNSLPPTRDTPHCRPGPSRMLASFVSNAKPTSGGPIGTCLISSLSRSGSVAASRW